MSKKNKHKYKLFMGKILPMLVLWALLLLNASAIDGNFKIKYQFQGTDGKTYLSDLQIIDEGGSIKLHQGEPIDFDALFTKIDNQYIYLTDDLIETLILFDRYEDGIVSQLNHKLSKLTGSDHSNLALDFETLVKRQSDYLENFLEGYIYDTWKYIFARGEMRMDKDILQALERLLNDNADFAVSNKSKIDNILKNLGEAQAKCKTCPSSVSPDPQLGNVETVIDDLNHAITQYKSKPTEFGFAKFVDEMAQGSKKAKGGAFTLHLLKNRMDELSENGTYMLKRFEGTIPDQESGCLLDLLFENPVDQKLKNIEVKNWSKPNELNYNQFKAYLGSGNKFEYYFNGNGQAMKPMFQKIFKDSKKAKELYLSNETFFKTNGINSWEQLVNKANNNELISHSILNFIKN